MDESEYGELLCDIRGCPLEASVMKVIHSSKGDRHEMDFLCAYHYNNPFKGDV